MRKINRKKNGISVATAIMFVSFIVFAVLCITRFYDLKEQYTRLHNEADSLDRQKAELEEELMQIRKEANNSDNRAYIESMARTHLDMVYPGEIIYRISNDNNG